MKRKERKASKQRALMEELEPRLLFSADWAGVFVDPAIEGGDGHLSMPAITALLDSEHQAGKTAEQGARSKPGDASAQRRELVIIDAGAPNYQQLIQDLMKSAAEGRPVDMVILDSGRDGITQISEALAERRDLSAVHIISHGDDASLQLGNSELSRSNLKSYAKAIKGWGDALSEGADLMLYGCDLAETGKGRAMVDALAKLTGADVAASTDSTGKAALGGDWELEYHEGDIETGIAFSGDLQREWQGTLAAPNITARETVDSDANGQIDRIKITTDQNLNDIFSDLTMTVSGGYVVSGYSSGTANDAIFYVDLTESGSPDTGATPIVTVTGNTLLGDFPFTAPMGIGAGVAASDTAAPAVIARETADLDGDGSIDAIHITFSEAIVDGTVLATDWDVAGVGLEAFNPATNGDAADDDKIYITFTDGLLDTAATPTLSYTLNATADGAPAANKLATFGPSATTDKAAPVITAVTTRDSNGNGQIDQIELTFNENIDDLTAEPDDFALSGGYTVASVSSGTANDNTLFLNVNESGTADTDQVPTVTYAQDAATDLADLAGNLLVNVGPLASVDGAAPAVIARETADLNGDGSIDAIHITFSEAIVDGTVLAGDWDVAGVGLEAFNPATNGDAPNDDKIYITFADGVLDTAATPTLSYTLNATADAAPAANKLATFGPSATTDMAAPVVIARETADLDGDGSIDAIHITFSEAIADGTVLATDWVVAGGGLEVFNPATNGDAPNDDKIYITFTDGLLDTAATPTLSYALNATADGTPAANKLATFGPSATTDKAAPVITALTTRDSNGNGQIDQIELTFNENIDDSTAELDDFALSGGYTVASVSSGTANDNTLFLNVNESGTADTNQVPTVTYTQDAATDLADLAGNLLVNVGPLVPVDGAAPVILAKESADLNGDGFIDAIHITFSEAIVDGTVLAGDWDVAGVGLEAFNPATNGDGANDDKIYITFADGVLDTGATPDVTYTQGALADAAGNQLASDSADAWWDTNWQNRKKIAFDNTNSAENLTDFPVLVSLTAADVDFAKIKAGGADIRFVDNDGTVLNYEIEAWDDTPGLETATVWVKVQQIDANVSTDYIHLYYNNTAASDAQNASGVWDTNYMGVWHLGEDPTGASPQVKDSTSNSNDGIAQGTWASTDLVDASIGKGLQFDGTTSSRLIRVPDSASLDATNDEATFSLWINWTNSIDGDNQIIMSSSNRFTPGLNDGYEWAVQGDGDYFNYPWGGDNGNYNMHDVFPGPSPFTNNVWHHLAGTLDFATKEVKSYLNGASLPFTTENVPALWTTLASPDDWLWGGNPDRATRYFDGLFDEIRVADVVRSAEWIEASYLSQNGSFAFTSFGNEQVATTDKAAPVITALTTRDSDGNGQIDQIELTFNENIDDSTAELDDFALSGGYTVASVSSGTANDNTLFLNVNESGTADTNQVPTVTYAQDAATDLADLAGNLLVNVGPLASVDGAAPAVIARETADLNGDGFIDAIHITFSEAIVDGTVLATDWDVAGVGSEAFNPATNGDAPNDDKIYITFTDGLLDTAATPTLSYTLNATADAAPAANKLATFGPSATTDKAAPVVIARETADLNGDGFIDAIHITFSEAIVDGTVLAGDWDVAGVGSEAFNPATNGDAPNDDKIYITFADGVLDTGATPTLSYALNATADGAPAANKLAAFGPTLTTDMAAPVILSATATQGSTALTLAFSEAVDTSSLGPGNLVLGDFNYVDVSAGGAASIFAMGADADGTDKAVTLTANAAFNAGDNNTDTIAAALNEIYDLADVAVGPTPVALTIIDSTPPTITARTTRDSDANGQIDRIELTFDENIDDSTAVFTDFSVAGYAVTGIVTGGGADDNQLFLTLTELGSSDTSATPNVTYTQGAVTDLAGNPLANNGPVASTDGALPVLMAQETADLDKDGSIDALHLTFSEAIGDASVDVADFAVTLPGVANLAFDPTAGGDTANDADIYLTFDDGFHDTGTTPSLAYAQGGGAAVQDLAAAPNKLADFAAGVSTDKAAPVILSATSTQGSTALTVTFSEAVDTSNAGPGDLLTSDFSYADVSAGGAAGVLLMADGDGTDGVVTLTADAAFNAGDDNTDTIAAVPNGIYDLADVAAETAPVAFAITDSTAPTITARTTRDSDANGQIDRIELTFDENINDASANPANFSVAGYTVTGVDSGAGANDNQLFLTLTELAAADTDATPAVTYTQGTLADTSGNPLANDGPVAATDGAGPAALSYDTADLNNDGSIDAIHVTFSEAINDATVSAADWDVAGVGGEAFSSTTNGDAAGDTDIYITFADGVLDTGATPALNYTQNATADVPGNLLASFNVTPTDKARPVLLETRVPFGDGATAGLFNDVGDRLDLVFSETLAAAPSQGQLEAALSFTIDGDNLPDIGAALLDPVSFFSTASSNDTLQILFSAGNVINADLIAVGTHSVALFDATNLIDLAGNTAYVGGAPLLIDSGPNAAPANAVPAAQSTPENTSLVFSAGNSNLISISDPDAGPYPVEVELTVTDGTITLSGVAGLTFSVGDGTSDAIVTFTGTVSAINSALDGLTYTPTTGYAGPATLHIKTNDQGFLGSGGPLQDQDVVAVDVVADATNDAPTNSVPGPQTTTESTPLAFSHANGNAISVVDDAGVNPIEVTLTATNGTITLGNIAEDEFLVSSVNDGADKDAALAVDANGNFVAVWEGSDDSKGGIFLQRYDADGFALGGVTAVNTTTLGNQKRPQVAMDSAGDFVVVWEGEGNGNDVYFQRYDATGAALGGETLVNTTTAGDQKTPHLAMDAAGDFVIVWEGEDADGKGVYFRRYTSAGIAKDITEKAANTITAGDQKAARVAMEDNGDFAIVWEGAGDGKDVYLRRYDAAGNPLAVEAVVNATTTGDQKVPDLAMDADGDFVVVWEGQDSDKKGVYLQRYNSAGVAQGGETLVNTTTGGDQKAPRVAMDADGDFAVVWEAPDSNKKGVYVQRYDSAGNAQDVETLVNTATAGDQKKPDAVMSPAGDLLVAWKGPGPGGDDDMFVQRYQSLDRLTFSLNDGVDDVQMIFTGTQADVNNALNGLVFTPDLGFNGTATLEIKTDDQGNSGAGVTPIATDLINITVQAIDFGRLFLSTINDVAGPGANGLGAWDSGQVISFSGGYEPAGTTGGFSTFFNIEDFSVGAANVDANHYVGTNITVGTGTTMDLFVGDLLLSTDAAATLPVLGLIDAGDVFVFRPTVAGNYGAGTFQMLLDNLPGTDTRGISLAELDTVVGGTALSKGTLLFANDTNTQDIFTFSPVNVGAASTGTTALLIDGSDIGFGAGVAGLELIENTVTTVGGSTLASGSLLVSMDATDTLGGNAITVDRQDVFYLTATSTGLGTTAADATMFFDGSAVGLDVANEDLNAVSLVTFYAPSASDNAVSTAEDTPYVFTADDFNFSDPDRSDTLQSVTIVSPPAPGSLALSGAAVIANQVIAIDDINNNLLTFTPVADANGAPYTTFTFTANDVALSSNTATMTIDVTAVNDLATVANIEIASLAYTENDPAAATTTAITVSDPDNLGITSASVQISANYQNGQDILAFTDTPNITGFWDAATGTMTLTGADTPLNYQAALRSVTYANSSNAPNTSTRTVSFTLIGGSVPSNTVTRNITVAAVNDAPTLGNGALAAIAEDTASPAGQAVFVVFFGQFADADAGASFAGIAVVGNSANAGTEGAWQYSSNAGANWYDIGGVTDGATALALDTATLMRFVPVADYTGVPTGLTVRGLDNSYAGVFSTTAGAENRVNVDTTGPGGTTAIAALMASVSTSVTAVNDAPTLGNGALAAILEDAANPTGQAVATVFAAQFADIDAGATFTGIAVVGNSANAGTEGVWQYSSNAGVNWYDIGAVADGATALSLDTATLVRFVPVADFNGVPTGLTVRGLDNTYAGVFSTAAGAEIRVNVDTTSPGGTTAIAALTASVSTSVTLVNDEPILTIGGNQAVAEDSGPHTVNSFASAAPGGGADEAGQTFTYNVSNDNNPLFLVQPAIDASGNLSYTLTADANGLATITVTVSDTGGTANGGDNTSPAQNFTITVNPVNDAPTLGNGALAAIAENTSNPAGQAVSTVFAAQFADIDAGASFAGIAVVGNSANAGTEGVWQYSSNAGVNWYDIGGVADGATALAVDSATLVRFVSVVDYNGVPGGLTVRGLDNTYAGVFSTTGGVESRVNVNTTSPGGTTAIAALTASVSTSVAAVNNPPTATITAPSYAATEQTTRTLHGTGLSVADVDAGGSGVTATLSVGEGVVNAFAGTTGVVIGSSGTNSVTLTGTTAQINNLLAGNNGGSVDYFNALDDPSTSTTLTLDINDAGNSGVGGPLSDSANVAINITPLADPPVVTAGAVTAYTENAVPVVVDNTVTLSDADDTQLAGATVVIGAGFTAGDALGFTLQGGVLGSFAGNTLTLSGAAAVSDYQAILRSVTYASSSEDPTAILASRTITWQVTDADSDGTGPQASAAVTSTVNVTPLGDAPVATAGATAFYTENGGALVVDNTVTLSDIDDTQMVGATVAISAGLTTGDVLGFTPAGAVIGSYNAATGTLTLSGTDSPAAYRTVLRSVTYMSTSEDPTVNSPTRTISWQVTDADSDGTGAQASTVVTSTVDVTALADPPAVTAGATAFYTENGGPLVVDNTVTLSDVDDTQMAGATVAIGAGFTAGDVLGATDAGFVTSSYNAATGTLTLSGTDSLATYRTVLRSVTYMSTSEDPTVNSPTRTITWQVTDADSDGTGAQASAVVTSTVNVTPLGDAPVATAGATAFYTENGGALVVDNTMTLSDADDTQTVGATVAISAGLTAGDVLGFTPAGAVTGSYNAATGVLTLSGIDSPAAYQTVLRSVTYMSTSEDPTINSPTRTISWQVTDADSDSTGAQASAVVTSTVDVTALADPPVVTAGATAFYTENDGPLVVDSTVTLSDADDTQMTGATVAISAGLTAGDVLGFTPAGAVTGSYNAATGVLTLSGIDSPAAYQTVLRSVTYLSTSEDPTVNSPTRTISWQVTDADSDGTGAQASAVVTSSVAVTPINDAPITANNTGRTLAEGSASPLVAADLLHTDAEQGATSLTYTVTAAPGNGRLELVGAPGVAIAAFTQDDIDNGRVVYVHGGGEAPADAFSFQVSDGVGGVAAGQTFTFVVTPVNDAPVNTLPGAQSLLSDTVLIFSGANGTALVIADTDAATVSVTLTATNGSLTLAGTVGLVFTAGDGMLNAAMTFTGTLSDVNAALNGLSYTPTPGYIGAASVQLAVDDQGGSGAGGPKVDIDTVSLTYNPLPSPPTPGVGGTGPGPSPGPSPGGTSSGGTGGGGVTPGDGDPGVDLGGGGDGGGGSPAAAPEPEPEPVPEPVVEPVVEPVAEPVVEAAVEAKPEAAVAKPDREPRKKLDKPKLKTLVKTIDLSRESDTRTPFRQSLDVMSEGVGTTDILDEVQHNTVQAAFKGTSFALSAGFLTWALRGASLLASVAASLPAWQGFDPLPVLAGEKRQKKKKAKDDKGDLDSQEARIQRLLD